MMHLQGKTALVTGGAQGIGRAIALSLAKAGADVAVSDVNLVKADETAAEISALGVKGFAIGGNVADSAAAAAMVDEAALRQIADITGGQFFRAKDANALREVYAKIAQMEKKEITVKRIKGYRQLFPWFAGAGLVMLALGALAEARWRALS
jgi:NAD(P)-dependent dehydrogenase (short-subunit alcohol dehydrogenase family)